MKHYIYFTKGLLDFLLISLKIKLTPEKSRPLVWFGGNYKHMTDIQMENSFYWDKVSQIHFLASKTKTSSYKQGFFRINKRDDV